MTNVMSNHTDVLKARDQQINRLVSMLNQDESTPNDIKNRNGLLARLFKAVALGEFQVNGQPPDQDYQLAEYLIHGGRILFDLQQLDADQQIEFKRWLKGNAPIEQRAAATHAIGTNQAGMPIDIKTTPMKAMINSLFARRKGKPTHFGMDVHAGGYGNLIDNYQGEKKTVAANGEFGHLYINDDPNHPEAIQMGIEEAGALKTNQFTGDYHSPTGGGGKFSAFGASRLGESVPGDNRAPLILPESRMAKAKYNWNRVVITPAIFSELKRSDTNLGQIQQMLTRPHPSSVAVTDVEERMNAMANHRIEMGYGKRQIASQAGQQRIKDAKVTIENGRLKFKETGEGVRDVILVGHPDGQPELYYCDPSKDVDHLETFLRNHGFEIRARGAVNVDKQGKLNVFSGLCHGQVNVFNVLNLKTFFDAQQVDLNQTKIKTRFDPSSKLGIQVTSDVVNNEAAQPDYYLTDATTVVQGIYAAVKTELKDHIRKTKYDLKASLPNNFIYRLTAKAYQVLLKRTTEYGQANDLLNALWDADQKIDSIHDCESLNAMVSQLNSKLEKIEPRQKTWLGKASSTINQFKIFKKSYKAKYFPPQAPESPPSTTMPKQ